MDTYNNDAPYDDTEWMSIFFNDDFNAHSTLAAFIQKSDLETLQKDLRNHGSSIQQQMTDILRDETEAIVNLAEHLNNLTLKIEELSIPFFPLREEITSLHTLIDTAETGYQTTLARIKENNASINDVNIKIDIISTSVYTENLVQTAVISKGGLVLLERIISKYSLQRSYIHKLDNVWRDLIGVMENVEDGLVHLINKKFLRAFYSKNSDILTRCLRLYENLGKADVAQNVFRLEVVKPNLHKIFAEFALQKSDQNLDIIYTKILDFMRENMEILLTIVNENPALHSFNFGLNSFWVEFDQQSREGLPNITAPGNPEMFQKRFKDTYEVLLNIAKICGGEEMINENESFEQHLERFNLPVYLEIRYQQIAGDFEMSLQVEDNDYYNDKNEISCRLKSTLALKSAVSQCFAEDSYLDQLSDQFVKLSMLLLARYLKSLVTTSQGQFPSKDKQEEFIMNSLFDLTKVENFMCLQEENTPTGNSVYKMMDSQISILIPDIMKENQASVTEVEKALKNQVVDMKVEDVCNRLSLVTAIPRLYRRTNRSTPIEPSQYVIEALTQVTTFRDIFLYVTCDTLADILNSIVLKATEHYLTVVNAVLNSVFKTEESLRRLKSRNVLTTSLPSEESLPIQPVTAVGSDEIKIREQIKLDVEYFGEQLCPMCSDDARQVMDSLKALI